jgi:type II secretory pathway pseudopilin PulG
MSTPRDRRRGSATGLTLVELVFALALLAGLALAAGSVTDRASDAFRETSANEVLTLRAHAALERTLEPLAEAEAAALPPLTLGSTTLTYHRAIGFAGVTVWGPDTQVVLQYDAGELDDGLDNDADGLVDEGELLWFEAPGQPEEHRLVLARGVSEYLEGETPNGVDDNGNGFVDERGFWISGAAGVVAVRLTLERLDPQGRRLVCTVESSTRVRN